MSQKSKVVIYIYKAPIRACVCMYVWLRRVCIFWDINLSCMGAIRKVEFVSEKCHPVAMHGRDVTDENSHGQLNEWAYTRSFIKKENFWKSDNFDTIATTKPILVIKFKWLMTAGHQACINTDSQFPWEQILDPFHPPLPRHLINMQKNFILGT